MAKRPLPARIAVVGRAVLPRSRDQQAAGGGKMAAGRSFVARPAGRNTDRALNAWGWWIRGGDKEKGMMQKRGGALDLTDGRSNEKDRRAVVRQLQVLIVYS